MAIEYVKVDDLNNFKKLIVENKELSNWQHEEHFKCTLLRAIVEFYDIKLLFVDFLMRYADIDTKDNNGMTACMYASDAGHSGTVSMLLDRGADIHAKDNDG